MPMPSNARHHGKRRRAAAAVLGVLAPLSCLRALDANLTHAPLLSSPPAAVSRAPLTADDFYRILTVTDPQVSPDGKWVAYVLTANDRAADESRSSIWMVSWDGSQQLALTNPAHDIGSPRWSPDGRYLAYLAAPACSDKSQIMLLDRRGGEPRAATHVTDDIDDYAWSPDGKRLVLVMDSSDGKAKKPAPAGNTAPAGNAAEGAADTKSDLPEAAKCSAATDPPRPIVIDALHFKEDKDGYLGTGHGRHLSLFEIDSARIEPLTTDDAFNETLPVWSPDGRRVAFVRTRDKGPDIDGREDIVAMDAHAEAAVRTLQRVFVPNQQKLAWSSDGTAITFLRGAEVKYNQYTQDRLCVIRPLQPAEIPRCPTEALDRGIAFYAFAQDSTSVIATIEDDTRAYAARIGLRSASVAKLAEGPFVLTEIASAAGHTAVLHSDDGAPAEVYALERGGLRKLSRHNDGFMAGLELGAVEDLRFDSVDGTPIHGLMVKPPRAEANRQYPAILWIHGGPNLQDSHSLAFDDYQFKRQLLAARGYVVFGVNYRGSSGRGDAFSRAIFADWGHKEVEDLIAGTDAVVRTGMVDANRLGLGGWSYGGMLTDYTIASSTRFKAAVSGAGTANPLALYGADQYNLQYAAELGDPWRNTDVYLRLAYPFLHADRIRTPTLFMGGGKDFNVPVVGGEQMYLALRTLEVPTQLIVYPGEFHTLTRPSFLKDRVERITAWYERYLSAAPGP